MTLSRIFLIPSAVALMLALPATASARPVKLISGNLYGGPSQTHAHCYITNSGPRPIPYTEFKIVQQNGVVMTSLVTGCNNPGVGIVPSGQIPPNGGICEFKSTANVSNGYTCSVVVDSAVVQHVRGIIDVRIGDTPLAHDALR